jgi:hypothetical protein
MPFDPKLTEEVRLSFRDELREARLKAQKDAEAFEDIVFVLERLGALLSPDAIGLKQKYPAIAGVAGNSPLASEVPEAWRELHTPFEKLYDLVREARNGAMHENAIARYTTDRAIELSIVLENALMNGNDKVSDFMVRNPVCAAMWQPLSFIRQTILASSFSCLPVEARDHAKSWHLVSDKAVALYLGLRPNGVESKELLQKPLKDAVAETDGLKLIQAITSQDTDAVEKVLRVWDGKEGLPVLVMRRETDELVGIVTPYDLL